MILALPYDTMVPLLVLCLLSPLLVASADTSVLKCVQGAEVSNASDCVSGLDACVLIRDQSTMLGTEFDTTTYSCGKSDSCANAYNITIGKDKHLRSSSACCTEDGCNAKLNWTSLQAPWTENGLTCPKGCYAQTEKECTDGPVLCTDGQRNCITVEGSSGAKTFVLHGCGTSNMCGVENYALTIGGTPYKIKTITCVPAAEKADPPKP
uniref:phospholipase A2 inhibitor and Ly6/PLAUR domain-containing protein-like n=1 Tax=Podarcis muralis TaxID=64176 RepID=UPI00109F8936|nr:phospholipase A2 inhibitor and Ly6/PLAUR domain-containing protein-like [Podarcis muralis]